MKNDKYCVPSLFCSLPNTGLATESGGYDNVLRGQRYSAAQKAVREG